MNDWNRWDWFFALAPFVVLAGLAVWAVHRAKKAGL